MDENQPPEARPEPRATSFSPDWAATAALRSTLPTTSIGSDDFIGYSNALITKAIQESRTFPCSVSDETGRVPWNSRPAFDHLTRQAARLPHHVAARQLCKPQASQQSAYAHNAFAADGYRRCASPHRQCPNHSNRGRPATHHNPSRGNTASKTDTLHLSCIYSCQQFPVRSRKFPLLRKQDHHRIALKNIAYPIR